MGKKGLQIYYQKKKGLQIIKQKFFKL